MYCCKRKTFFSFSTTSFSVVKCSINRWFFPFLLSCFPFLFGSSSFISLSFFRFHFTYFIRFLISPIWKGFSVVKILNLGSIFIQYNMNVRFNHTPTFEQNNTFYSTKICYMWKRQHKKKIEKPNNPFHKSCYFRVEFDLPPVPHPFEHILPCPSYLRPTLQST